ncbi:MAG: ATP-binding cassette domain-containing protein, partial [Bacteroidota bacterium]
MIRISAIRYSYPNSDFHLAIDLLDIQKGSKTAFIGPSGFGKTTTLNLIAGILLPDSGEIRVDDTRIDQLSDTDRRIYRAQEIGFVFQDFKLLEYLNVLDNVLLPLRINSSLQMSAEARDRARDAAASLGIEGKLNKYPSRLSHGERQRVAICRALLNRPPVILADEPTGNLDPANKTTIMEILFN